MAHGITLIQKALSRVKRKPLPDYTVERNRSLSGKARIRARKAKNRAGR
jgi:hypothetical protein